MKQLKNTIFLTLIALLVSCNNFLDIVPDNVATLDYAFRMRSTTQKYLFTCYSFLPDLAYRGTDAGRMGADEVWILPYYDYHRSFQIAKGLQNVNEPLMSPWYGSHGIKNYWMAISQCNIFLENIDNVPDMELVEKEQWKAEVKFLKAYYHFFLFKHFGPIPIVRENLPISASGEEVRVARRPVDEVVDYIIELIEDAEPALPERVFDENSELGRITLPIALGMKAKILVYAASPLFNGNTDYENYNNKDGTKLFNIEYNEQKWQKAVDACKKAIDLAHSVGYELYEFRPNYQSTDITDELKTQMNYRGVLTEKWNSEIIWANTNSITEDLQKSYAPRALNLAQQTWVGSYGSLGASYNAAALFYTKNGVPIDEDKTWNYYSSNNLRVANETDKYRIKPGYTTADFNFDREPRFYGALGFDGGIWYGNGKYSPNDLYWLETKSGQFLGKIQEGWMPACGYFIKKMVNYTNTAIDRQNYTVMTYPHVMLRLADLYLLYAEALNELNGPSDEIFYYLDKVRKRSGLTGVKESWSTYSKFADKYNTKIGLRDIIQKERAIEMVFEGERFWDLRRWKTASLVLNQFIYGWDVDQSSSENYYRKKVLYNQTFSLKDYFWPIREQDLVVNKNLVQSPGW